MEGRRGRCASSPIKVQYLLKLEVPLLWNNSLHEAGIWCLAVEIRAWGAHAKCCCFCRGWGLVFVIWLADWLAGLQAKRYLRSFTASDLQFWQQGRDTVRDTPFQKRKVAARAPVNRPEGRDVHGNQWWTYCPNMHGQPCKKQLFPVSGGKLSRRLQAEHGEVGSKSPGWCLG